MILLLDEWPASAGVKDAAGMVPLHYALESRHFICTDVIRILVARQPATLREADG